MQAQTKEDPLTVQVVCKSCSHKQAYKGQLRCDRCRTSGSLQLILKKEGVIDS